MKYIIISLTALSMMFYGCKSNQNANKDSNGKSKTETTQKESGHEHSDGHDHTTAEAHEHKEGEKHDHEGEGHSGCAGHDHESEAHDHGTDEHAGEAEGAHSDEIVFTQAQAARTDFEVKEIQPETFHQIIKTTGQVLPAPGDESVIVATSNGSISYGASNLTEGAAVRQGQILFSVASRDLAEGDHYSKVRVNFEKAEKEYKRAEKMVQDKIVSQKDFETIRLDYQNAKIAFDAIAGKQTAKGVGISSPLSGYIKNIQIKDGEYVTVGQVLGTVSQNKKLLLRAEVSQKHYAALRSVSSANFKTPYDNKVYTLSDLNGKMVSVGKSAADNSFFIPVTFEFDNRGDIVPGTFAEIYLISGDLPESLTLPVSALTNEMGIFYVYVQLDEEGYRKQEVTLGASNGNEVQILKGIRPGDRVVTRGAYQVKMASASGAIPHSHEH